MRHVVPAAAYGRWIIGGIGWKVVLADVLPRVGLSWSGGLGVRLCFVAVEVSILQGVTISQREDLERVLCDEEDEWVRKYEYRM